MKNIYIYLMLFIFSIMSVNSLSPNYLNADIIINSIMSLQNITLFYWGQNRLVNIMPLAMSITSDPVSNQLLYLVITSFIFYLMIWKISRYILLIVDNKHKYIKNQVIVFLFFSFLFNLIYSKDVQFDFILWHVEYVLSYLFLIYCIDIFLKITKYNSIHYILISVLVMIATGVNNSIIIPSFTFFILYYLIKRNNLKRVLIFMSIFLISFLVWGWISSYYGTSQSYIKINWHNLSLNINNVISNILSVTNIFLVFSIIFFFYGIKLLYKESQENILLRIVTFSILLFMTSWLMLFANIKWIEMNGYHYRYFFPIFIGIIFLITLHFWKLYATIIYIKKIQIFTMTILLLVHIILNYTTYVPLTEYNIFKNWKETKKLNKITENIFFHAGDYWRVWPAVLFDLIENNKAYGITYRSSGNHIVIKKEMKNELHATNKIKIFCHNSNNQKCISQVNEKIKNIYLYESKILINNTIVQTYKLYDPTPLNSFANNFNILEFPIVNAINSTYSAKILLKNNSNRIWNSYGKYPVSLSYKYYDIDGKELHLIGKGSSGESIRNKFKYGIESNKSLLLDFKFKTPFKAGKYILEIDLVQDGVTWFKDQGSNVIRKEIIVR